MKSNASVATTIPATTTELLLNLVRPYRLRAMVFFLLSGLGVLSWTASPVIIARIVDTLSTEGVTNEIWWLVAIFAGLRFVDEVFWRTAEIVMRSFKPQMVESVRTRLFAATLGRSHSYFVNASSGRIGHWINQTTSTTNEIVDTTIWTVWGRVVGLVISAIFLATTHWSLALLFAVWLISLFTYNSYRGRRFSQLVAHQSDETSKVSSRVVDTLSNHLSVRVHNAQAREVASLAQRQKNITNAWYASWRHNSHTNIVKGQSANVASVTALALVVTLYANGTVALGDIVLFLAYFTDASSTLWTLAWALDSYFRDFGTIQNALDGLRGATERQTNTDKPRVATLKQVTISFEDVTFAYPEQPDMPVLDQLALTIEPGEKIGLVGHSGAGKSTLMGLLLGLYEPTGGRILINDRDISQQSLDFSRSLSTYVPQDTGLFNRTIRENVAYAKPKATDSELITALKRAQAWEFVHKLPDELDTVIGERGVKLSGGQRQRLAIARAIVQNAPLVLLDEATSALDSVSEQAIQQALYELMRDRTAVVIAHRLSTLRHLDRILVMEDGRIVESGSHEHLLKTDGMYAELWKRQKDGFIVE